MRSITAAVVVCSAVTLCACIRNVNDEAAEPQARSALLLALDRCDVMVREFHRIADLTDCWLSAEQTYVIAVKLSQPDLYTNYAQRARLAAAQADGGRLTPGEFLVRIRQISRDFEAEISRAQEVIDLKRARATAAAARAAAANARQNDGTSLEQ